MPDGLDLVAMGGVPEAFVTAHDALVTQRARHVRGEWVLIHAVGTGVGTAGLQLAKALGAQVIGTARTAEKLERCRALGLDAGIVPPVADGELDTAATVAVASSTRPGRVPTSRSISSAAATSRSTSPPPR